MAVKAQVFQVNLNSIIVTVLEGDRKDCSYSLPWRSGLIEGQQVQITLFPDDRDAVWAPYSV